MESNEIEQMSRNNQDNLEMVKNGIAMIFFDSAPVENGVKYLCDTQFTQKGNLTKHKDSVHDTLCYM